MTMRDRLIKLVQQYEPFNYAEISEHLFWTNDGLYLRTIYRLWPANWERKSLQDIIETLDSFGQPLRFDPGTGAFTIEKEERIDGET